MLKDTRSLVARALKAGKSAEQMKKDHVLAKYEDICKGFIKTDNWIDTLIADVTQPAAGAGDYQNHGHANEK
jgi:hypothetical protein